MYVGRRKSGRGSSVIQCASTLPRNELNCKSDLKPQLFKIYFFSFLRCSDVMNGRKKMRVYQESLERERSSSCRTDVDPISLDSHKIGHPRIDNAENPSDF